MQNVVAVIVLVSIGWAFLRRLVTRPKRLTLNRDALVILAMIGGVVATELLAQVFEVAALRRDRRRVHLECARGPAAGGARRGRARGRVRRALVGPHRARRGVPVLPAVQQAPAHRHGLPEHLVPQARPARRAAQDGPRGRRRQFGLRTLQDLGWKDLLDGFTCTECGRCQEACPAYNTGKPLNPKTFIMGIRDMSVEAEHGIDLIPNSPIVRDTYGLEDTPAARRVARGQDRRHGHPLRRGLGLRDLRRLRRGVPRAHRARRQDRRAAPEPRARGLALPARAHRRVPGDGEPGQPVGPAVVGAARLGEAAPVRGPDGRRASPRTAGSTSSRSSTGSAARPRSTRATRRSPGRSPRACTRPGSTSRCSARRSRAPATRPGGWATTTCSRSSRRATSRR